MRPLEKPTPFITSVRLQFLPAKKISSRLSASFPHTMLKSFLAACAVLATGSAAAAGPYVNVENNAAYAGGDGFDMDYMGAVTELHVGIEGGDAASWYAQFGPALISPDNGSADVELSGKVGGSVVVSADEKLNVYGEVSFATVDDFGAANVATKIGAKYAF